MDRELEEALEIIRKYESSGFLNTWHPKLIEALKTVENYILKAQEQEKVLEIIIDREVSIQSFRRKNYKDYEDYCNRSNIYENSTLLTQEEFDLVKRYFKWTR